RWSKDQFSLFKNKNRQKKTVKQLKLRVGLIVFQYLRVSFFPDTFLFFYAVLTNMILSTSKIPSTYFIVAS
ncbi:IS5/IS1182 family transposase, partial [Lactobacillus crispatus]